MSYKVIDIYKDLPRSNCGDCGKASCFAFASATYLEAYPMASCPHLAAQRLLQMEARLNEGRNEGEGRRPASSEQALRALLTTLAEADLGAQAERAGGVLRSDPDGVELSFLGACYLVTREDVLALNGDAPTVWVKVFLLIYVTRATGRATAGRWISYRDLPNTVSKAASFEECAAGIADAFAGDADGLERRVRQLGGEPATGPQAAVADRAFLLRALPRVSLLLLFWDAEEEFEARVSLLLDQRVLDYLDQEAIVFLAEAIEDLLLGQGLDELVG